MDLGIYTNYYSSLNTMLAKAARQVLGKSPHDIVVLSAVRSPITRAFKGGFKDAYPEEILMPVRQNLIDSTP